MRYLPARRRQGWLHLPGALPCPAPTPAAVVNFMTLTDAAKELGVDPSTLRYRLKRGEMRGVKAGPRAWMIPVDEVERWRGQGRLKPGRKAKREATE